MSWEVVALIFAAILFLMLITRKSKRATTVPPWYLKNDERVTHIGGDTVVPFPTAAKPDPSTFREVYLCDVCDGIYWLVTSHSMICSKCGGEVEDSPTSPAA